MRSGFSAPLSARLSFAALAACLCSVAVGAASPALAARPAAQARQEGHPPDRPPAGPQSSDLGDMLFGRPPADTRSPAMPRLARFRADTGDTFVLEVTARGPT